MEQADKGSVPYSQLIESSPEPATSGRERTAALSTNVCDLTQHELCRWLLQLPELPLNEVEAVLDIVRHNHITGAQAVGMGQRDWMALGLTSPMSSVVSEAIADSVALAQKEAERRHLPSRRSQEVVAARRRRRQIRAEMKASREACSCLYTVFPWLRNTVFQERKKTITAALFLFFLGIVLFCLCIIAFVCDWHWSYGVSFLVVGLVCIIPGGYQTFVLHRALHDPDYSVDMVPSFDDDEIDESEQANLFLCC
mmetsp:Transcript_38150/g.95993  ORF Transcript_38150/g.95993 Transcript_38150/m.95993 type:complete len:254 (+) Transcript_38150:229-990(+)